MSAASGFPAQLRVELAQSCPVADVPKGVRMQAGPLSATGLAELCRTLGCTISSVMDSDALTASLQQQNKTPSEGIDHHIQLQPSQLSQSQFEPLTAGYVEVVSEPSQPNWQQTTMFAGAWAAANTKNKSGRRQKSGSVEADASADGNAGGFAGSVVLGRAPAAERLPLPATPLLFGSFGTKSQLVGPMCCFSIADCVITSLSCMRRFVLAGAATSITEVGTCSAFDFAKTSCTTDGHRCGSHETAAAASSDGRTGCRKRQGAS
eukprot:SAG31_NODE_650_length_13187_cov_3.011843_10_plen_264_part_00